MTTAEQKQIADADARREKFERATLPAEILLAIFRERIATLESAKKERSKPNVETAVERLVATGAVHPGNLYGQFNVLE